MEKGPIKTLLIYDQIDLIVHIECTGDLLVLPFVNHDNAFFSRKRLFLMG